MVSHYYPQYEHHNEILDEALEDGISCSKCGTQRRFRTDGDGRATVECIVCDTIELIPTIGRRIHDQHRVLYEELKRSVAYASNGKARMPKTDGR